MLMLSTFSPALTCGTEGVERKCHRDRFETFFDEEGKATVLAACQRPPSLICCEWRFCQSTRDRLQNRTINHQCHWLIGQLVWTCLWRALTRSWLCRSVAGVISSDKQFQPLIIALQVRGDPSWRQGSTSINRNLQPVVTTVHAISTKSLCERKFQKTFKKSCTSIRHDCKGLNINLETGGPQLSWAAMDGSQRPESNYVGASSDVYDPPRQGVVRGQKLTLSASLALLTSRGGRIDSDTLVDLLKRCSEQKNIVAARQVHNLVVQRGMDGHPYVATALLNVYSKCGRLVDAREVFGGIHKSDRNIITWNVIIGAYAKHGCGAEAYRLFHQMKREGFRPDALTLESILNPSVSEGALEWVKEVHDDARKVGLESNLRVGNALIHTYSKCSNIDDARVVFDRMEKRDVVTWNTMIGAYAKSGCGVEAYQLFHQMKREGFRPDAFTYASILNPSASEGALDWVKEVHGDARKAGLESNLRVGNALVLMYSKCGNIDDARVVFDRMEKRDVVTWTVMIGAHAESGCGVEAYRLFHQMKREGCRPDAFTYASILNPSASEGALGWVKEVHGHALNAGVGSDLRVANALVHMYAKCGSIDDARLVFDRMRKRNVITWTVMIGAYAESGCGVEAYLLFLQMKREGFKPDAIIFVSILNASASAGALEWVKEVHGHARNAGVELDLRVATALVHMYAKCGSIDDARLVFDRMEKRNVITWNAMIGGLALHGCGNQALKLFEEMTVDCVKPNETSFVAVLSACSHAGLVDSGRRLFSVLKQDYGVEATVVHYNCMVDLLGRAGHLKEAKLLVENMPVEPNAVTWTTLLGACRTYSNEELGEVAAKEVLKLEPECSGAYVLLSNIYAATGNWEKVSSVRSMMEERGVRKEPGRSWIEVDNKIHEFIAGDTSHPEAKAIYSELEKLTEQLKAKGYVPDAKLVLRNVGEEEKELAICCHSEKLAIAYGLLRVPRDKRILVEKNLQVCSDCHGATKLISEVTGRKIIVRDANRFHHFKDGVCSCGDYW